MANMKRNFVKIISEICHQEGIDFELLAHGWIFRLHKNGFNKYIIGYQFDLNSAAMHSICCDKSAASEIMHSFGISHIEHEFFMHPEEQHYINQSGMWGRLITMLHHHKVLVCKPNDGTGGKLIFKVSNEAQLEEASYNIFNKSHSMAVAPFYEISNEYRIIVLDGEIQLVYTKIRPHVVGDGVTNIAELITKQLSTNASCSSNNFILQSEDLSKILHHEECFYLNWKHNLGLGAKAIIVDDESILLKLKTITNKITDKMNIRFASIDIVECAHELKVLEINSAVMMDFFSDQSPEYYNIAKEIYKKALLTMFTHA